MPAAPQALDTCSSTSKAPYDSTQGTDCTHVPSQEEEEEDEDGLGPQFIFDTLASSGKSAVSRTDFLIDGLSHQQDGGEGEEDEEAFESPRSTTDGSLYVLGDAWVEEETRHFGQVIPRVGWEDFFAKRRGGVCCVWSHANILSQVLQMGGGGGKAPLLFAY
eukprot:1159988-Pelagomonas_calceolata.AAC.2